MVHLFSSLHPWSQLAAFGSFISFFWFFFFFLATSWEEGDRADPHTLPGSREQRGMSRATAGAAAFAQSRETKERSSSHKDKLLLQPITGIIRKTPAKRQNQAPFLEEPIAGSDSFQQPQPHSRGGFASRRFQATPERFLVPFASLWSILGKEQPLPEPAGHPEPGSDALAEPQQGAEPPEKSQQQGQGAPRISPLPGFWEGAQSWCLRWAHSGDGEKTPISGASTPANAQHASKLPAHGRDEQQHPEPRPSRTHGRCQPHAPPGTRSSRCHPRATPRGAGVTSARPPARSGMPQLSRAGSGVRGRGTPPEQHPEPPEPHPHPRPCGARGIS